jgi:hypothetical protein
MAKQVPAMGIGNFGQCHFVNSPEANASGQLWDKTCDRVVRIIIGHTVRCRSGHSLFEHLRLPTNEFIRITSPLDASSRFENILDFVDVCFHRLWNFLL